MSKQRWVVKIGSALLVDKTQGLNHDLMRGLSTQIASLMTKDIEVVLVSSGAIAKGMKRLSWDEKPNKVHELQAAAAVGQAGLVQAYEQHFLPHNIHTAQILLTHDNLQNPERIDNIINTLETLLSLGVVPILNENDTVAIEEICFGDNDILAAMVANCIKADKLIIITDQSGLFDADPRQDTKAKLIKTIAVTDPILKQVASKKGGTLGTGGMYSKIIAAEEAAKTQTDTYIVPGLVDDVLLQIFAQQAIGTHILASK